MNSTQTLEERRQYLSNARDQSTLTELIKFRGQYQALPVVKLPLNLPLFRSANGRLAVLKAEYLKVNRVESDFFENGEELPEVQHVLQQMLIELAKNPDASIYQELRGSSLQTDRLLLTGDGVVLDGNRRLASMRSLYEEDSKTYAGFFEVETTLLPEDTSIIDIEMIEASRQMAPDLKLPYGWVDRRLKLRYHRDILHLPTNIICEGYRLKSEEQLHHEIEELELAETYLSEYLGQPLNYKSIEDAEGFFIGLHEQLAKIKNDEIKKTWQLVGFAMIKEAKVLDIEPKQFYPFVPSRPSYARLPVLELFGGENELWPFTKDLGTGAKLKGSDYKSLIKTLNDPNTSHSIAEKFMLLFNQILTELDERPHPIAVVNRLKQLNQNLGRLDLSKFTESQRGELFGQLAEIPYLFQYLTKCEDKNSVRPIVVMGFTPIGNYLVKRSINALHWIKGNIFGLISKFRSGN